MNNKLALRKNEQLQPSPQLLTPSEVALARELEVTANNSKTVLTSSLSRELFRLYGEKKPEAIEWVFRTHRDESDFWPSIHQLGGLFEEYAKRERGKEKAEFSAWTPEGLKQWHALLKEFTEKLPTIPCGKRYREPIKNTREALKTQAERLKR